MRTFKYDPESLAGKSAVRYNGERKVMLPDGTELECATYAQAEALKSLINAVVVTQRSPV